jgi:hypothetical protein
MHHFNNNKKKNNIVVTAAKLFTAAITTIVVLAGVGAAAAATVFIGINQSAYAVDWSDPAGGERIERKPAAAPSVVTGENVYVVWWNGTGGGEPDTNTEVLFRASNDNGATFSDKINLSNTTASDSIDVEIAAEGANVIVTWWERNQTANEPVMRISNDSGQTFGPLLMLSSNGTLSAAASSNGGGEEEEEETTISNSSSNGYDESDATADDLTEPPPPDEEGELDPEEEEPAYEEPPPSDDSDSSSDNEGRGNNSDSSSNPPPPPPRSPPSSAAPHPVSYWLENEEGITQDLLEKAAAERHNNDNNDNNEWSFNLGNFRVPVEFDVSDSENDTKGILELYIEGEEVNNDDNTNAYDQLAAQLLAAKLNIKNDVPACESIETTVEYADTVLQDAQYEGPGSTENPTGESRDYAFELIEILDSYNNNGCV